MRRRYAVLAGGLATLAVIAAGGYVLGDNFAGAHTSGLTATKAHARSVQPSCSGGLSAACKAAAFSPSTATGVSSASSRPTPPKRELTSAAPGRPRLRRTAAAAPSVARTETDGAAASVLAVINQARAQRGLPAYAILHGLQTSARKHNQLMAGGCGLSHQCPGEAALGARETAAGVRWTAAGENVGEGGPVADTARAITQMATALVSDMLNEKPPDDGHRLNLLSSTFTRIGIAIYQGSDGTVWMTQDFAN